jgi:short subunit dehydrogenase-like uncharacterized protein
MSFGRSPFGAAAAGGSALTVGLGEAALGFGPTRALLDRLLPKPGQGPSPEARAKGWFRMDVMTRTTEGASYEAVVAGAGDPGYAATAVMMGEAALCLAHDEIPDRTGVLTPATAMGTALADRLRAQGMELSVRG